MEEKLRTAASAVIEKVGAQLLEFRDQTILIIQPEHLSEACRILRDDFGFESLAELTAVDYWPQEEPRFHLIVGLRSIRNNMFIGMRVPLNGNNPSMPTLTTVYPNANWFEREVWDMFGISFDGHPDPRRIIMPYEWEGHPLRKDYPLGYEEVQFSFNSDEIDARKPYAKE